jgi:hypothetical protein
MFEAFKQSLAGSAPAPEPDGDEAKPDEGMSPGDQALAAIKSNDGAAFEEAIRRITSGP